MLEGNVFKEKKGLATLGLSKLPWFYKRYFATPKKESFLLMTLATNYKRFTVIGLGHLLYAAFNWSFDHIIYVYVVFTWGIWIGGGGMMLFSMIQCAITLQLYEKMQIDWVGAGTLHSWEIQQPTCWLGRVFRHINKKPKAVFLFLCVFSDPFITTAYFRKGRFDGLTSKDWRIFVYSVLIINSYWICVSALLGNGIVVLWQWLSAHSFLIAYLRGWF